MFGSLRLAGKPWFLPGPAIVGLVAILASSVWAEAPRVEKAPKPPVAVAAEGSPAATPKLTAKQRKVLKALIGRWKIEDGEDELEFRPDGSFVGKSHTVEMTAKYEVTPEGKLVIDLGLPVPRKVVSPVPGNEGTAATPTPRTLRVVREVRFDGKKLVLQDPDSKQTFRYTRLR